MRVVGGMKAMRFLVGLLCAGVAGAVVGGEGRGLDARLPGLELKLPAWSVLDAISPAVRPVEMSVEWKLPKSGGALDGPHSFHWKLCGMAVGWTFPERAWTLASPVGALGDAFLGCRQVKVTVLDPRVRVADYPDGHFGEWVRDGWLVTRRVGIRDEARIRQVFDLLLEATIESIEPEELYFDESAPLDTFEEYRRRTKHAPDLIVEFIGVVPFRAEICLERQTVVFISATEWEPGQLNKAAVTALRELVRGSE